MFILSFIVSSSLSLSFFLSFILSSIFIENMSICGKYAGQTHTIACIVNTKLVLCPFRFPHNNKWNGPKGAHTIFQHKTQPKLSLLRAGEWERRTEKKNPHTSIGCISIRWPIAMNVAHNNILFASILISGRYWTSITCASLCPYQKATILSLLWPSFLVDGAVLIFLFIFIHSLFEKGKNWRIFSRDQQGGAMVLLSCCWST